jgi:hypothetical protein
MQQRSRSCPIPVLEPCFQDTAHFLMSHKTAQIGVSAVRQCNAHRNAGPFKTVPSFRLLELRPAAGALAGEPPSTKTGRRVGSSAASCCFAGLSPCAPRGGDAGGRACLSPFAEGGACSRSFAAITSASTWAAAHARACQRCLALYGMSYAVDQYCCLKLAFSWASWLEVGHILCTVYR